MSGALVTRIRCHCRGEHDRGFTLLELSIVLVIIGLIVGGVLTGRDLILAAQRRSVAKDIEAYASAVATFRAKFNCLPGDCFFATNFWPQAASCTVASISTETCNGNGSGVVDDDATPAERYRFWQHLSNAGMLAGHYTGVAGPFASWNGVDGTNGPTTRYPNCGMQVLRSDQFQPWTYPTAVGRISISAATRRPGTSTA